MSVYVDGRVCVVESACGVARACGVAEASGAARICGVATWALLFLSTGVYLLLGMHL